MFRRHTDGGLDGSSHGSPGAFINIGKLSSIAQLLFRIELNETILFRPVIVMAGSAIILMHQHPSGDCTPSEGDIRTTRDLIRAGQLLKIDLVDHVIIGEPNHTSLRNLGYFSI